MVPGLPFWKSVLYVFPPTRDNSLKATRIARSAKGRMSFEVGAAGGAGDFGSSLTVLEESVIGRLIAAILASFVSFWPLVWCFPFEFYRPISQHSRGVYPFPNSAHALTGGHHKQPLSSVMIHCLEICQGSYCTIEKQIRKPDTRKRIIWS